MARYSIGSADHALACALFGQLRPGDHALFISQALGEETQALLTGPFSSLEDWGVKCTVLDPFEAQLFTEDGTLDTDRIASCAQKHRPDVVVLQRFRQPFLLLCNNGVESSNDSSGTTLCKGTFFTCSAIQEFVNIFRGACMHVDAQTSCSENKGDVGSRENGSIQTGQVPIVVLDNRGGELIEQTEPGTAGVDLVTGSLLGSLGGSVAPSGGYVCGRQELVEKACARFSAPGVFFRCFCIVELASGRFWSSVLYSVFVATGMSLNSGAVPGDTMRLMFQGMACEK